MSQASLIAARAHSRRHPLFSEGEFSHFVRTRTGFMARTGTPGLRQKQDQLRG